VSNQIASKRQTFDRALTPWRHWHVWKIRILTFGESKPRSKESHVRGAVPVGETCVAALRVAVVTALGRILLTTNKKHVAPLCESPW
jgi:hypothetical protein